MILEDILLTILLTSVYIILGVGFHRILKTSSIDRFNDTKPIFSVVWPIFVVVLALIPYEE